jgi:predicted MFS family arabinose efflux permease
MNIAAFNVGIAFGSYLGGVITDSAGLIHTTWIGSLMVFAAVILTGWNQIFEKRDQKADGSLRQVCS